MGGQVKSNDRAFATGLLEGLAKQHGWPAVRALLTELEAAQERHEHKDAPEVKCEADGAYEP